ncbi:hypothetical protein SAMN05216480_1214 [Pustulibacterium marinum]|uniref:Uncharacterized protein n=1 Tax=Pustulibacterium marinum TaxID=1224947 RepID=A0A1I7ISH2_9FLAO|nr:hypothetical protein SAMN05216480_1214 [Pustulibacterium marinum]
MGISSIERIDDLSTCLLSRFRTLVMVDIYFYWWRAWSVKVVYCCK